MNYPLTLISAPEALEWRAERQAKRRDDCFSASGILQGSLFLHPLAHVIGRRNIHLSGPMCSMYIS